MDKIYLEQVLEQLVDKANVIILTKESESAETYCLGNHYAAKWWATLQKEFTPRLFLVSNITIEVKSGTLMWVVTIDHAHNSTTDRLATQSNCIIRGLDF